MKVIEINLIDLLTQIGWADSRAAARRMLQGGLRIDNEPHTGIEPFYFAGSEFIMSYGKRRWIRIVFPAMKAYYADNAADEWKGG